MSKGMFDDLNAMIDHGLQAPFWRLAFENDLERRFNTQQFVARINHAIRSGWLALLIFNCFLLVDWLMVRDVFWESVLVRVVVFTPLCLIVLLSGSYLFRPELELWKDKPQVVDWLVMLSGWSAASCLAAILFRSHSEFGPLYHAGFMIVILYGNLVQKLTFRFAVVFTVGVLCVSWFQMLLTPGFPQDIGIIMSLLLTGSGLITLAANFLSEKSRRRYYLLQLREQTLVQDLRLANEQLQKISRSDVLTGLFNRRHFHDYLHHAWSRAEISNEPVAVLMIDVDHFKAFNDLHGHQSGDECLKQVAMALEENLRRPGDLVARYGGEEFVAVLPNTGPWEAQQAAARVRKGVEMLMIQHGASDVAKVVTISIGIGVGSQETMPQSADQNDAMSGADRLLAFADHALYEAKRAGRNCVKLVTRLDAQQP